MQVSRIALALAAAFAASAAQAEPTVIRGAIEVGGPVTPVIVNRPVLPAPRDWQPGDPIKEIPLHEPKGATWDTPEPRPNIDDPVADNSLGGSGGGVNFDTPIRNQDGSTFSGVNPSDTVGDVGINHYVQIINNSTSSRVLILNKSDGTQAANFLLNTLATGSGTSCGTSGQGDPTVNFDESVNNGVGVDPGRWVLTEFTNDSFCVYISQTASPIAGTWFVYEFNSATGGLPDYPKFAVWPDGYYIGANEPGGSGGPSAYVLDRERMLLGQPARPAQRFAVPNMGSSFQFVMPVDWDGKLAPPAGAPGVFLRHRDTEVFTPNGLPGNDFIEVWEFDVDWTTPANSTLTGPGTAGGICSTAGDPRCIPTAEFDSNFCNLVFAGCLAQPGTTTTLFPLWQPPMWRAQYRNFGSHQSIVSNLATDVGGDVSAVRWYELRKPASAWTMFQQGSTPVDGVSRFMASAATDEAGNIAVGYNVVNGTTVFPGMRYRGRLVGDAAGTLPRGEVTVVNGVASNASTRYGDYSALAVDPVDGCTFWYTAQYNPTTQWRTRITSFRFDACGTPGFYLSTPENSAEVCTAGGNAPFSFDLDVGQISGFTTPVTLSVVPPVPAGITTSFTTNPITPPNSTDFAGTVASSVAAGDYALLVRGVSPPAVDRDLAYAVTVFTQAPGQVVLTAPANGATNTSFTPTLSWGAQAQSQEYVLEISTSPTFATIAYTRTVTGTTHVVETALPSNTQHFWRVRASNICNAGSNSAVFSFTTQPAPGDCPAGVTGVNSFSDTVESGANGWTHNGTGDTWAISNQRANSGTFSWKVTGSETSTDQRLVSPSIVVPPATELPISLKFATWQHAEIRTGGCWDGMILEVSTNDGGTWTQVVAPNLLTLPYDGPMGSGSALTGLNAWCADPARGFLNSVVNLASFAGQTVRFRFRFASDGSVTREGMYIDDVTVQSCPSGPPDLMFSNSFE